LMRYYVQMDAFIAVSSDSPVSHRHAFGHGRVVFGCEVAALCKQF
jgi:hypothetical protein